MPDKCPNCGSDQFLPEMKLLTEETVSGQRPVYVKVEEPKPDKPPFMWIAGEAKSEFHAFICSQCGFASIFAEDHQELSEGVNKGYLGFSLKAK